MRVTWGSDEEREDGRNVEGGEKDREDASGFVVMSRRVWGPLWALQVLASVFLTACLVDREEERAGPPVVDGDYRPVKPVAPAGWPAIEWPKDNPYDPSADVLGRRLFHDGQLSRGFDRACSWCHAPYTAFVDVRNEQTSSGTEGGRTTRNSPTLANMAFLRTFMFDGRFESLEAQALGPLFDHEEMDMTDSMIVTRLQADTAYVRMFRQAFGDGTVTLDRVAKALATYQRTLISHRSPYDRWRAGEATALSPAAQRGEILFRSSRLGCASCHTPPLFSDGQFHNTGLYEAGAEADSGRAKVTGSSEDLARFKTPTLRNIAVTFPYMHDGRFNTIEEVLAHYNQGGTMHPVKDGRIRPLALTPDERADLTAFLESLTDQDFLNTSQP